MGLQLHPDASLDPPTLDDQRAAKFGELQAQKALALAAMAYTVGAQTYRVTLGVQDQVDVQTQIALLQSEGEGATAIWEIVDNVFLIWGASDLQALQTAGVEHVLAAYANAAGLAAQVGSAADPHAVDVTEGWPS